MYFIFNQRSWQEKGEGNATSSDDVRHDGRRCDGSHGDESGRFNGRQSFDSQ